MRRRSFASKGIFAEGEPEGRSSVRADVAGSIQPAGWNRVGLLLKTVKLYPKVNMKNQQSNIVNIDINVVKSRMLQVRGQQVLLDRDVAALYGVETRIINQAVKNNPGKFPEGYVVALTQEEIKVLRSKILTLETNPGKGHHSKHGYKVFTEKGLYMLATILKGEQAVRTTLSIIETYAEVRAMKRELLALHAEPDAQKRNSMMRHFGEALTDIVMPDLTTAETESSLEINFLIGKLKHTVRRVKKAGGDSLHEIRNKRVRPFCICFTVYAWRNVIGFRGSLRGS